MFAILLVLIQNFSWAQTAERASIVMVVGETTKITAKGDLLVGPENVVKASDLGAHYRIEAVKPGHTEIRNGGANYRISVLRQDQRETWDVLSQVEKTSLGLRASVSRGEVWLEGSLSGFPEWERIAKLCSSRICDYRSRFRVPNSIRGSLQKKVSEKLRSAGFGSFLMRWEPEFSLMVPATVPHLAEIQKIVASYGIRAVADPTALELAPSIRAQILIAEVRKDETRKYGLQWPESYSAQLIPKTAELEKFSLTAHFLESRGWGKVLATPSVLCRSGKDSEFLAGGEIPIKIINFKMQDVIWKRYGVLLRLRPRADFSGRMSIDIETEVSSIDGSHTVDGIPGFFTNRVQTHFDLSEPRTIALSGLMKNEESHASSGLPGISRLPILGALFSSRDYKENRTELVIFVRPEVVNEAEGSDK